MRPYAVFNHKYFIRRISPEFGSSLGSRGSKYSPVALLCRTSRSMSPTKTVPESPSGSGITSITREVLKVLQLMPRVADIEVNLIFVALLMFLPNNRIVVLSCETICTTPSTKPPCDSDSTRRPEMTVWLAGSCSDSRRYRGCFTAKQVRTWADNMRRTSLTIARKPGIRNEKGQWWNTVPQIELDHPSASAASKHVYFSRRRSWGIVKKSLFPAYATYPQAIRIGCVPTICKLRRSIIGLKIDLSQMHLDSF
jgi:hypothetical protein